MIRMHQENTIQKLQHGSYYHIYNRGNNKEIIFKNPDNYFYFLNLWKKHVDPIAETFCFNLLPNHFHFFIRIREIDTLTPQGNYNNKNEKALEQSFSNLFNAYAKAINKMFDRTGSLFQERFRRKEILNDSYFTSIIGYIITNAVKHGYCKSVEQYPYSSYQRLISEKPTRLLRTEVIEWFGTKTKFIDYIRNFQNDLNIQKDFFERFDDDE